MREQITAALRPLTGRYARLRPGARVLMYHRVAALAAPDQLAVSPAHFRRQMRWLKSRWRVLPLARALRDPAAAVVITFDDGYLDNLHEAAPVLAQFGLSATVYLSTDFVEQRSRHPRYRGGSERLHLNWAEVRALHRDSSIDFGAHSCSHPALSELGSAAARREIFDCKARLEDGLGDAVTSFAYPNGNFGQREVDLVREAGYRSAVTVKPGLNRAGTPPLRLRRTEVTDRDGLRGFAAKLDGAFDPIHQLLDWRREWQFHRSRTRARHST